MSQLIYNGIPLQFTRTNSFQRIVRMSDDKTEYMWTDFIIDINFIYAPSATSYPTQGLMPEVSDVNLRFLLMQPRQPLYYAEGGIPILSIPSNLDNGGAIDAENGPIPMECTIPRIAGASLLFGRFVIKTSLRECPDGSIISAVASSRYSRSESLDGQFRSTIITNGRAYFRSDVLAALAINSDAFRGYLVPSPFLYYRRKQMFVNLESSGIVMEFTAIDEEQFVDLGDGTLPGTAGSIGIVDMDLNYSANLNPKGSLGYSGYTAISTVDAMAIGTRTANTWSMLQFLYAAAYNKFQGAGGAADITQTGFTIGATAKENIFRNEVALSLSFMIVPGGVNGSILPDMTLAMKGYIGIPIAALPQGTGINPQLPYSNSTRGIIPMELAASAFATACYTDITDIGSDPTGQLYPPDLQNTGNIQIIGPQVQVYFSPNLDPGEIYIQQEKEESRSLGNPSKTGYLNYSISAENDTDYGIRNVPIASSAQTSSGGVNLQNTTVNIQLFQPATQVTYKFLIERVGAVPEVPTPTVTQNYSSNFTLLRAIKTPISIELMPDGYTPIYRITGAYTYSLLQPILDEDAIPFPIPAWVNIPSGLYTQLISSDFEDGIINNPVQSV
jgi:hypothetical protein